MSGDECLLGSHKFRQAVASIQKRAEKQMDWKKVEEVFVHSDLRDRIESPDSQLVLGRRGTGKTHLLRVFQKDATSHGQLAFYFDCARLGSGYSGLDVAPHVAAQKYFIAFLNALSSELLEYVTRMERPGEARQDAILGQLIDGFGQVAKPRDEARPLSTFEYGKIASDIERVLNGLDVTRVFLILDEWAMVPFDAQPHLGEYLKRAILSVPQISAKILAVNYQCQFIKRSGMDNIGLERGADIPDVIDMDRYLVFDEKREFVKSFFSQVLYNHLGIELGWPLDRSAEEKKNAIQDLFTQIKAFEELVRAAEGNCRDFLGIFARAYFEEFRQSIESKSISIPNVVSAATSWFDSEKAANVNADETARSTLTYIIKNVLREYKARTFLVESSKAEHPRLIRLLNERVLHRLNGTYHHPDRPGIQHDLFTVDYGAFVRFRKTVHQVREMVFWENDTADELTQEEINLMVPIDDNRSIRRITFDPETMTVAGDQQQATRQFGLFPS